MAQGSRSQILVKMWEVMSTFDIRYLSEIFGKSPQSEKMKKKKRLFFGPVKSKSKLFKIWLLI